MNISDLPHSFKNISISSTANYKHYKTMLSMNMYSYSLRNQIVEI